MAGLTDETTSNLVKIYTKLTRVDGLVGNRVNIAYKMVKSVYFPISLFITFEI